jgi:hypothetical protein
MWFNPFLAQQLAKERVEEALRSVEQKRWVRGRRAPAQFWLGPWVTALLAVSLVFLIIWQMI